MKDELFQEIADKLFENMDSIVRSGQELLPVTIVISVKADKVTNMDVIATPYNSDAQKQIVMRFMQHQLARPDIEAVAHISEAWMVVEEDADKMIDFTKRLRPSQDPRRVECAMLTIMDKHRQGLATHKIIRKDKKSWLEKGKFEFLGAGSTGTFVKEEKGPMH